MHNKQRFLVNLIFDPEYGGYVADVPQLPGCMSQGKSVEAALKNVRKAIKVYLKDEPRTQALATTEVLTSQIEVRVSRAWPGFLEFAANRPDQVREDSKPNSLFSLNPGIRP